MIRYTSFSPADVIVDYRLSGAKGPLSLGEARDHFAKKGLFRTTEKLSKTAGGEGAGGEALHGRASTSPRPPTSAAATTPGA